jgi:hypothetical protein
MGAKGSLTSLQCACQSHATGVSLRNTSETALFLGQVRVKLSTALVRRPYMSNFVALCFYASEIVETYRRHR